MASAGDRKMTIFVEGNLSSGKTTLLEHIQQSPDVETFEEPVDLWRSVADTNLYALLFADRARWGFMFQSFVQLTMLNIHTRMTSASVKVMERSIHSGRHIFVENLFRAGEMTGSEYTILDRWLSWLTTQLDINPDLIVYLRSSPELVLDRMRRRSRSEESSISLPHLQNIHDLHEEWLVNGSSHAPSCPVMVLDANSESSAVAKEFDEKWRHFRDQSGCTEN